MASGIIGVHAAVVIDENHGVEEQHLLALVVLEIADVLIGAHGVAGTKEPGVVTREVHVPLVFKGGGRRGPSPGRHGCGLMLPVDQVVRRPNHPAGEKEIVLALKAQDGGVGDAPRILNAQRIDVA